MAEFTPSKKTAKDFNNGVEYVDGQGNETGDALQAETINNLVESALYTQEQVDNANSTAKGALSEVEKVLEDKTLFPVVKKNLYNLGAFDTFVSNGDGTGTVVRKTGYATFDCNSGEEWISSTGQYPARNFVLFNVSNFAIPLGVATDAIKVNSNDIYAIESGFLSGNRYIEIFTTKDFINAEQFKDFIYDKKIEYLLTPAFQYVEKVIENYPLHIANQNEDVYWHNEWRKGLNILSDLHIYEYSGLNLIENNGTRIKIQVTDNDPYIRSTFLENLPNGTYTISVNVGRCDIWQTINGATSQKQTFTVPISGQTDIHLEFEELQIGKTYDIELMLVKGTRPYPYEFYNGNIIHENRLPLFMTLDGKSPAEIIGGDWESKGSFTSGSNTIYVWRKL